MKKEVLIVILIISVLVIAGCTSKIQKSPPIGEEGESEGEGPGRYFREVEICNTDSDCEDFYIKNLNIGETVYFNNYINAIKLLDIEGSTKIKIQVGEAYGQDVWWFGETWTPLNELALLTLSNRIIIQPIQISPETGSAVVKIAMGDTLALDGEILNINDPITVDGNTIELERVNVGRYGDNIGNEDDDLRTLYGTIIEEPSIHGNSDEVILEIPQEQVKANLRLSSASPVEYIPYDRDGGGGVGAVIDISNLITGKVTTIKELRRRLSLGTPLQSEQGFPEVITDDDLTGLQDTAIYFNGNSYDVHDEIVFLNNYTNVETDLLYGMSTYYLDIFIPSRDNFPDLAYYYKFDTPIDLSEVSEDNPLNITFLGQEISIVDISYDGIFIQNPNTNEIEEYYNGDPYFEQVPSALLIIEDEEYLMDMGDWIYVEGSTVFLQNMTATTVTIEVSREESSALLIIEDEEYLMEVGETVIIDNYKVTLINVGSNDAYICVEDEYDEECGIISEWSSETINGLEIFVEDVNQIASSETAFINERESDTVNGLEISVEAIYFEDYFVSDWSWELHNLYDPHPTIGITSPIQEEGEKLVYGECKDFPDVFSLCFDSITQTTYNTYSIKYNSCRDLRINGCFQTFDLTSDLDDGYTLLANGIDGLNSDRIVDEIYLKYDNYQVYVYYNQNGNIAYAGTTNLNAFAKKTNSDIKFTISEIFEGLTTLSITTIAENLDESIDIKLGINNNFFGLGYNPNIAESNEIEWSNYVSPDYISAILNINNIDYTFHEDYLQLVQDLLIKVTGIDEENEIVFAGIESVNQYECSQEGVITKDISYNCFNYQCYTDLNSFRTTDTCEAPEYCINGVACCTKSPENFFPITSWHTGNQTSSLQTLRDIGFNSFTLNDLKNLDGEALSNLEALEEANKYNLKHFLGNTYAQSHSDNNDIIDQENILNDVNQYCSYPSLSRYYLNDGPNDEPYENEVDEMAAATSMLNSFDPEHPGIAAYSGAFDLLAYNVHPNELYVDAYPISSNVPQGETNGAFTRLTTILSATRETALNEGIPLWFIAQAFGVRDPGTLDVNRWREPTPAELREQVYLALAYGAKGISYYRYSTEIMSALLYEGLVEQDYVTPREPLFSTVSTLNNELNQLAPSLLNLDSLAVCNSRTLNPNNENTVSVCRNCSYGNWGESEQGLEIREYKGKSVTFDLETNQNDDIWYVFRYLPYINSSDSPYIKVDYEVIENNGASLYFQPIRSNIISRDYVLDGYLTSIPMPSSIGQHAFYTYLDDLKGKGVCETYRNCIDCISPACEKNVSISVILADVRVDFVLEEGETVNISNQDLSVTSISWDKAKIRVDYCERDFLEGQTWDVCGLDIRLNEINRITTRSESECTLRCESDKIRLRFYMVARDQGNSMKLKINDITEAYCELPFVTSATQDVEIGNFKDNNDKKYIMVVNRDPQNQITTEITFSSIVAETGLTDMLTSERFSITQNQANIPLDKGHGRLLRLDQPS